MIALLLASALLPSITAETVICHSHIFHSPPSSIVNSILTDASNNIAPPEHDQASVLDIDASSSRLDDESITTLIEGLLLQLHNQTSDGDKVKLKLGLDMNRLTPGGVARLFDRLLAADGDETVEVVSSNETSSDVTVEMNVDTDASVNETTSDDAANTTSEQIEVDDTQQNIEIEEIDLSLNDIGGHGSNSANLEVLTSVRRLFEQGRRNILVPRILSLENCGVGPAFCRSIGRGILNAFENQKQSSHHEYRPSILRLGGNEAIGDPGVVSLAAALRLAVSRTDEDNSEGSNQHDVLKELILSSCNVGDAGAESIALALAFNPGCLSKLDLSSNQISDIGATAIGRALVEGSRRNFVDGASSCVVEEIILDNNIKIGDDGAEALAEALACGAVRCISLRSCSVNAGGAAVFGKSISMLTQRKDAACGTKRFEIDLSGNTLGIRPVKKKKGLKDKASSHITSFGKTLQKGWRGGLKGAGVSMGLTAESDDDEEVMGGLIDGDEEEDSAQLFAAATRCGARAFASELLKSEDGDKGGVNNKGMSIRIGLRRCNLDDGAFDALAAAIIKVETSCGVDLVVDVSLNTVSSETASALSGDTKQADALHSMARRHLEAVSVLKEAQERAAMAADAAMARADVEKQFGGLMFDDGETDYDPYDEY